MLSSFQNTLVSNLKYLCLVGRFGFPRVPGDAAVPPVLGIILPPGTWVTPRLILPTYTPNQPTNQPTTPPPLVPSFPYPNSPLPSSPGGQNHTFSVVTLIPPLSSPTTRFCHKFIFESPGTLLCLTKVLFIFIFNVLPKGTKAFKWFFKPWQKMLLADTAGRSPFHVAAAPYFGQFWG